MEKIKGIGVSKGISLGYIFKLNDAQIVISEELISDTDQEVNLLKKNIDITKKQIENLKNNINFDTNLEDKEIFDAHIAILEDPELINKAIELIETNYFSAPRAVKETADFFINIFQNIQDELFQQRLLDIKEVTEQLIKNILNINTINSNPKDKSTILIAQDLTLNQLFHFDLNLLKGIILKKGSKLSHLSIIARNLKIPLIISTKNLVDSYLDDQLIIMNGLNGEIIYRPDKEILEDFKNKIKIQEENQYIYESFKNYKTLTLDGKELVLLSNIGNVLDSKLALSNGAEGIGLFRTEFLFMESSNWPNEEKQFNAYKQVIEQFKNKEVTIRMLDIGADKKLPYFTFDYEENPALGLRGVRFLLSDKYKDILHTQVRALLRASKYGSLSISIPMLSFLEEFQQIKNIFKIEETKLIKEGHEVGNYKLGALIETPSTVEMIEKWVQKVDFISVGTNDLIQYTFAVDRMSTELQGLYQPLNPAILSKLEKIISAANKYNIKVTICGEISSEPLLIPLLIGMNLKNFSMSSSYIPDIRYIISQIDSKKAFSLLKEVKKFENQDQVIDCLKRFIDSNQIKML